MINKYGKLAREVVEQYNEVTEDDWVADVDGLAKRIAEAIERAVEEQRAKMLVVAVENMNLIASLLEDRKKPFPIKEEV